MGVEGGGEYINLLWQNCLCVPIIGRINIILKKTQKSSVTRPEVKEGPSEFKNI